MTGIRYIFREDEPVRIKSAGKANPQVIGETLDKIRAEKAGELHPEAVVNHAKDKKSPLHPHFEWNDAVAAHAHRLDQARNLIRIIRVEDVSSEEGSTRAFHSISGEKGLAYRHVEDIRSSAEFQLALLNSASRELEAFKKRYRSIVDICEMVDRAQKAIDARRNAFETREAA